MDRALTHAVRVAAPVAVVVLILAPVLYLTGQRDFGWLLWTMFLLPSGAIVGSLTGRAIRNWLDNQ